MLDLDAMRTSVVDSASFPRFKISEEAHDRLKKASKFTGRGMSEIVETLIMTQLPQEPG